MSEHKLKKIVYLGSPQFAVPALAALLAAGYAVPLAITQPDRPKGRKKQLAPTAVKEFALRQGLPVLSVSDVNDPRVVRQIADAKPDLLVVAAFGQLLREPLLQIARYGVINIHASLLPEYRGAAPVQQAIIDGRTRTGVTIMYVEKRLDAGAMLAKASCDILPQDDCGSLRERLAALGAELLLQTLPPLFAGELRAEPQDEALATYAAKITSGRELVDWSADATTLHDLVRGLAPDTSAYTCFAEGGSWHRLKLWRAEAASADANGAPAGTVLGLDKGGLLVAAGRGALRLLEVQPAGKGRMDAAAWWRGRRDFQLAGLRFASPEN